MSIYGEVLDDYEPERDNIYNLIVEYFNNPIMTKIKDENGFSMYVAKIYTLLSQEKKYIIVFVYSNSEPIGTEEFLHELKWISFQTRSLQINYKTKIHPYEPQMKGQLTASIYRVDITDKASTYRCEEFPIVITLLHTPHKDRYAYQDKGNIIASLETWETIITFTTDT